MLIWLSFFKALLIYDVLLNPCQFISPCWLIIAQVNFIRKMQILGPNLCPKHNKQALKICTNTVCFDEKDILVCPNCSSKHISRQCQVIQITLLNGKVKQLMSKRVDFQRAYDHNCEEWLNQLRKFKIFKQEITTCLNARERALNDICRKIRRSVPYEKDKHLFKKSFGSIFLSMRALNPNYELYQKFSNTVADTINDCYRIIHRLRINHSEIPFFLRKQQPICAVISENEANTLSVPSIRWSQPNFSQFRRETIKYSKIVQAEMVDSKLLRVSDDQFLAHNSRSKVISSYNIKTLSLPKPHLIPSQVENIQVLGKNLFITNQHSNIFIYDLLNERMLKEYASSNHRQAKITSLLALDRKVILNFVSDPNQIVAMKFDQPAQTLKVVRGIETQAKALSAVRLRDSIVTSFDDHSLSFYSCQGLQKQGRYDLQSINARSLAVMDDHTLLAGGESSHVLLVDQRTEGIVGKFNMHTNCLEIKKIYPTTILVNLGNCLKLYQFRMQKELIKISLDSPVKYMEVLNSTAFITSGKSLSFYEGIG